VTCVHNFAFLECVLIRTIQNGRTLTWILSLLLAAYHFHGVPKHMTERKVFGCYSHDNMATKEPMCHGLPLHIGIPVSRHTTWKKEDMESRKGLKVLLESPESGPCCLWDPELVHVHMINHFEYDADTLHGEYLRDSEKGTPTGEPIHVPKDYYPNDDPSRTPLHKWESAGQVFYSNWLMTLLKKKVGA
jgi:homoserine O-succinyltransferase